MFYICLELRDAAFPFLDQHSGMASTVSCERRDIYHPFRDPAVDHFCVNVSVSAPYLQIMLHHA